MTTRSSILAWKSHALRRLVGHNPMSCKRVRHLSDKHTAHIINHFLLFLLFSYVPVFSEGYIFFLLTLLVGEMHLEN